MSDYDIWFDWRVAHASIGVEFLDANSEEDGDCAELTLELHVSAWERSYYRPAERDFEITDISLEEFGRTYHFDLEDVLPENERDGFMTELERAYDAHADECRAEAYID
ncbi:MAG TPA: hypothetical protein VJA26_14695 [Gammaproteobacteria bacterium]|nr:hypothetical protein [Gammaproteobacteria bacterium]